MQLHLSAVNLAHVHKLVDDTQNAQAVTVHEVVKLFLFRIIFRLSHLLERVHDKGEGSSDLMRKICEHLELHLLDLRLFLFFPLVLLLPFPLDE